MPSELCLSGSDPFDHDPLSLTFAFHFVRGYTGDFSSGCCVLTFLNDRVTP